jgi:hypothetical protein
MKVLPIGGDKDGCNIEDYQVPGKSPPLNRILTNMVFRGARNGEELQYCLFDGERRLHILPEGGNGQKSWWKFSYCIPAR